MKLFLDACAVIYLIESQQEQGRQTRLLVDEARKSNAQLSISRLSFLECRVLPLKIKNAGLLDCYDRFLRLPGLEIVELDATVIDIATELRANHRCLKNTRCDPTGLRDNIRSGSVSDGR